jgi:predicted phage terminase large subunit-like protein
VTNSSALSPASAFSPTDILAARRELARRHVNDFARMVEIPTVPISDDAEEDRFETLRLEVLARHHDLLLDALQDVADGITPNLMVFMPPGSAKSTYVDVVFVPWFMARKPKQNVILTSYGSDLARKQGRRARQLVKSKGFQLLFDTALSAESSAADEWSLANGSEYMAGGILSGVTGNRADLLVVDDPVKGREEADSETIRKKTLAAYQDDLTTRLKPGGRQVIIQTRWHEDDLSGSILPDDWAGESGLIKGCDGRLWRVLCIPAIAGAGDPLGREPGEYLWPEWFPEEHWQPFKQNQRTWSALYQQRPQPDEGTFFQRAWFKEWEAKPTLRYYGSSDYAVTDGGGDYTVHRVWGIDAEGHLYRVDGWRGQTTSDAWVEKKLDLIKQYRPLAWFGEGGVIQKAVEPMIKRRMRERSTFCRLEWLPSVSDKPTRARSFQAMAASGRVFVEPGADLSEFLSFPAGKHDDDVDTASLIGRAIDQAHPAIVAAVRTARRRDGYWPTDEGAADSWKTI